jgi:hypothetical protein
MAAFSAYGIISKAGSGALTASSWLLGFAAAMATALNLYSGIARYNALTRRFEVSGSWLPLVLLLTIFWTRFAIGVAKARFPAISGAFLFLGATSLILGACSGAFAARSLAMMSARSSYLRAKAQETL